MCTCALPQLIKALWDSVQRVLDYGEDVTTTLSAMQVRVVYGTVCDGGMGYTESLTSRHIETYHSRPCPRCRNACPCGAPSVS